MAASNDKIFEAIQGLSQQQTETSTQVALVSQSVGELSSHVSDVKNDVREVRDRLTTVETKVEERTQRIATAKPNYSTPPNLHKAKAKLINAKAALYLALAGSIGALISAVISYLT